MRLIDADALIAEFNGFEVDPHGTAALVHWQPTVDAVKVIRCLECKYYDKHFSAVEVNDGKYSVPLPGCKLLNIVTKDDFYCAMGELKDE